MTITYSCPECYQDCFNTGVDDDDMIEGGGAIDFACEECNCEFEVTYRKPEIHVTKHGYKLEGR
jgi:hypothetical protein